MMATKTWSDMDEDSISITVGVGKYLSIKATDSDTKDEVEVYLTNKQASEISNFIKEILTNELLEVENDENGNT